MEGMEGMEGMEAAAHNPPALKTRRGFNLSSSSSNAIGQPCKGFSLVEAAIVLGVVGAVIGTIWVAAATMYENYKVNKTVEGILTTARNMQNTMSLREAETAWGYSGTILTSQAIKLNVFPEDWVQNNTVKSPLGGGVDFFDFSQYPASYPKDSFMFGITLPKSVCIKFIVALSNTNSRNEAFLLRGITVNFPSWDRNIGQFPITPAVAATGCTNSTNSIYAYFPYTRIN